MQVIYHDGSDSYLAVPEMTEDCRDQGCVPVKPWELRAGTQVSTPCGGHSTVIPDFDVESYCQGGLVFHPGLGRSKLGAWKPVEGSTAKSPNALQVLGAPRYAEDPSFELLCLSYNLKDGKGERMWVRGMPPPQELFDYLAGKLPVHPQCQCPFTGLPLIEAHNSGFEGHVWERHCVPVLGWPSMHFAQLRCSASKCRAYSLMAGLKDASKILELETQKQEDGTRILKRLAGPQNPTKKEPWLRILPQHDPIEYDKLHRYNVGDTRTESGVSACVPDLPHDELKLWLLDQQINNRGVQIDMESVKSCRSIIEQAMSLGNAELHELTDGAVGTINQDKEIKNALARWGVDLPNMQKETVEDHWEKWDELHPVAPASAKRVLELRATLNSAAVKKLFAMDIKTSFDGRMRDLFIFCGADRTGRFAGQGAQPQNLPNSGPDVARCCPNKGCGQYYDNESDSCPHCNTAGAYNTYDIEWNLECVEQALGHINHRALRLEHIDRMYGNPVSIVSACLRGLFISAPGHDLLCSDYSAIEAVVLAFMAGEQWRMDVFNGHGKIYEASASQASGVPLADILQHKTDTGYHHPLRKLGKVRELAGGYQGWLGAWMNFGAGAFMSESEIVADAGSWRNESPAIVRFWKGASDAALNAVRQPGRKFDVRGITYQMRGDILFCRLLSGRELTYHKPSIYLNDRGKPQLRYWGRRGKSKGWGPMEAYGGKLVENITQATARDIMTYAMINVANAGYSVVLHVHDELVTEVLEGTGSIEELEHLMGIMPDWCKHWPVKAAGGWRRKRFGKD